jgi:muramidase (phage lysozyme)
MKAPGPLYIIAAATVGVAAYVYYTNSQANGGTSGGGSVSLGGIDLSGLTNMVSNMTSGVQNSFTDVASSVSNPNVQAFLSMVRIGEGTAGPDGYTKFFGGSHFSDLSRHPNVAHTGGGYTSTAAGAYQIVYETWLEAQAALSLPDFSPASQDAAAVWLIKRRGALADVMNGAVDSAISKCNKEWASLAGAPYGQPVLSLAQDENNFAAAGGVQTDAGAGLS